MRITIVSLIVFGVMLFYTNSFACNVCHSKNPKMQKMHKELEYKDCFKCHSPLADKPLDERKKERESDPVCSKCHKRE